MGNERKKIAFLKLGPFSHTNASVIRQLLRCFSDFQLEVIDVPTLIAGDRRIIFRNKAAVAASFPWRLITRRSTFQQLFYRTEYMVGEINRRIANRLKPNLHEFAFTLQTQSLCDGSVRGIPHFIYTDHTNLANMSYPIFGKSKVLSERWHRIEQRIYGRAVKVFTMSTHVSSSLIEHYHCSPEKVVCILAGPNAEQDCGPLLNDDYRNKNILFVGTQWEQKGGPLLVEAFKRVLERHPDAQLTIVGVSPRVNVANCDVVGRVPLDRVPSYFRRASIFCLPTQVEAFGIVFLEAMFARIPVVAPGIGALPDFIEDNVNGRLVEPNDVASLAEALITLLDAPEKCRKFAEKSLERVSGRYTWEAVGDRLRDNILNCVSREAAIPRA